MADTNTILIITNMLISFLSPLVLSFSYYIKHISESSCCNSKVKIREDSDLQLKKIKLQK